MTNFFTLIPNYIINYLTNNKFVYFIQMNSDLLFRIYANYVIHYHYHFYSLLL